MSKLDDLEKLAQLKEKGILSQEEFETEKNKILSSDTDDDKNGNIRKASFKGKISHMKKMSEEDLKYKKKADILGWFIAFSPIYFDVVLVILFGENVFFNYGLYFFAWGFFNTIVCSFNDHYIKKAYGTESNLWFLFLVPVYLYKQAKQTNADLNKFTTWMICLVISLFLFN